MLLCHKILKQNITMPETVQSQCARILAHAGQLALLHKAQIIQYKYNFQRDCENATHINHSGYSWHESTISKATQKRGGGGGICVSAIDAAGQ